VILSISQPSSVKTKVKLWTFHFIKIMFVGFIISLCTQMQKVMFPLYMQFIGGSKTTAGLMVGIFAISALLFRPLVGTMLDKKGRKVILVTGITIVLIASLSYYFVYHIWLLLLLRLLHGIGFSACSTSAGTIGADVVPKVKLMEGIGYYSIATAKAVAVGPALGLYLTTKIGYNESFLIIAGFSVLGLIAALMTNYEKKDLLAAANNNPHPFFEKNAVKPSFVMFFLSIAQGAVLSFLPSYAYSKGVDNIGIFFTIYAVTMMFSRPAAGKLCDYFGAFRIILPMMLLAIISLAMIPLASSLSEFVFISILYGLSFGTVLPLLNGMTIKLCPPDNLGSGNATFLSSIDAGYGIGSILWGVVSQNAGFTAMFFGAAGSVNVSMMLFIMFFRKIKI